MANGTKPGAVQKGAGAVGFAGVAGIAYLMAKGLLPGAFEQLPLALSEEELRTLLDWSAAAVAGGVTFAVGAARDWLKSKVGA